MEMRAAYKRFDAKLPSSPRFPRIISLPPLAPDFIHPVEREHVDRRLRKMPEGHLVGLRAVFLLSGTRKQEQMWRRSVICYGAYWRACVFLCAYPFGRYRYIDDVRNFCLNSTLPHEVAHHLDDRNNSTQDREAFANAFVERNG
jgi:hypothetical protein